MTIGGTLAAVVALLVAGVLRAAGTAISRIPRADALRDASDGVRGAARVADLLDERDAIAPAVGMLVSALLLIAAVVAMALLAPGRTPGGGMMIAGAVGLVSFLIGDLIPRRLGRARPRVAYRTARLVTAAVRLGGWANDLISDPDDGDEAPRPAGVAGEVVGEEQERELIDSVLGFGETIVREVMTPRPDMVTVSIESSIDELVAIAAEEGFSRVPVTSNGDVVGLVIVKDLLPALTQGERPTVGELMRPVEFVPDSKLASTLLGEMQESHVHQMIVVDEYGDVAGLVTIEDLLEELVGEIADETDEEEVFIASRGAGIWAVDARLPAEDLAETAHVELPDGDWDTVGGLVMGLAERIPEEGERLTFGSLSFTVTRMQGRRVSEVEFSVDRAAETG